jgi:hypothetical protein
MTESSRASLKKRVLFAVSEDYYFITYNSLLLLARLQATSAERSFLDHRRLAFLVEFVADPAAAAAATKPADQTHSDVEILRTAYARGLARLPIVNRLVFALEQKGLLRSTKAADTGERNVYLARPLDTLPFLDSDLFAVERENIEKVRAHAPQLRKSKLPTTLARFFRAHGVETWGF